MLLHKCMYKQACNEAFHVLEQSYFDSLSETGLSPAACGVQAAGRHAVAVASVEMAFEHVPRRSVQEQKASRPAQRRLSHGLCASPAASRQQPPLYVEWSSSESSSYPDRTIRPQTFQGPKQLIVRTMENGHLLVVTHSDEPLSKSLCLRAFASLLQGSRVTKEILMVGGL